MAKLQNTDNSQTEDNANIIDMGAELVKPLPQAWPRSVKGTKLLDEIVKGIRKHVSLPEHQVIAVALWILHAHLIDAFRISPILALPSPTKRCGKTTMLTVVGYLVPRALSTARTTPAAVYRAADEASPTLLVDEADTFIHSGSALRGILNSGHTRDSAYVIVTEKSRPRKFRTWCPKVIAAIGELPDTIEDRSIVVPMRRKARSEKVEPLRVETGADFEDLCRKAVRWARDNFTAVSKADPDVPDCLHDRAADNWWPLLAVADTVGGRWRKRARQAATKMCGMDPTQSMATGELLIRDIHGVLKSTGGRAIESSMLAARLAEMEGHPWPEFINGRPITKAKLARLLRPFGVTPSVIRRGKSVFRGYHVSDFADAFTRYAVS